MTIRAPVVDNEASLCAFGDLKKTGVVLVRNEPKSLTFRPRGDAKHKLECECLLDFFATLNHLFCTV